MGGSGVSPLFGSDRVSQPRCRRASAEQEMDVIDDEEAVDLLAAANTDDDDGDDGDEYIYVRCQQRSESGTK